MTAPLCTEKESIVIALRRDAGSEPAGQLQRDAADELERLMNLIDYHNHCCQSVCGFGEMEGVRCKYRAYFPRRCPECPTDWKIER
jgi:hypothetical protein